MNAVAIFVVSIPFSLSRKGRTELPEILLYWCADTGVDI